MKFIITRTSGWKTKPCEESTPRNAREWEVEVVSLEEFVKFVKKYTEVVFNGEEIEIYDDYRE